MLHKYLFRHHEVPLLYDIRKHKKTQFQITIPKAVYRATFKEMDDEKLKMHFSIKKCISYEEHKNDVVLSFDVLHHRQFIMQGLNRIFNWLNNEEHFEFADKDRKQVMTCTVAHTALAVSFAPWMHEYFKDKDHSKHLFSYAELQMKEMQGMLFGNSKAATAYTECSYREDGFHFRLFGNGLWFAGNYRDNEFDTHNCDTSIDQTVFFTGCVALCDALRHYLKTGKHLI